jgi:hypothetical protein
MPIGLNCHTDGQFGLLLLHMLFPDPRGIGAIRGGASFSQTSGKDRPEDER